MFFYVFLLLSSMIVLFFSQYTKRKFSVILCVMITLILGAVASFRGLVGTDTYAYHLQFEEIRTIDAFDKNALKIEPAFVMIAKLIQLFGGNSFAYIFFIGILQTLLLILIIRRLYAPALFLICYIASYYISFHYNIIREATSLLLIMISLTWLKEGGWKFFITLIASLFFHYSSIFFVPYVLLYKQLTERKYIALLYSIPIIVVFTFVMITMVSDVLIDKYDRYGDELNKASVLNSGIGFLLRMFLLVGLGVILFKRSKLDATFFVLPVILIQIFSINYPLLSRFNMFFYLSLFLLLTQDVVKDWQRQLTRVIIVVMSLLTVYGSLQSLSKNDQPLDEVHSMSPMIPYHTLFDENYDEDSITY